MSQYTGPDSELAPDAATMLQFLTWWFRACRLGVVEIGWLGADRRLTNFATFEVGQWDELVAVAVQNNLVPGQSLYIRAATVRAGTNGRTTDADFVNAPGAWHDVDTPEQLEAARRVETLVRPNAYTVTGTVPHMRVQSYFRCSEPLAGAEMVRSLNRRVYQLYGGDPSVINPTRLMRLPGSIAWPWKPGRVPEVTRFMIADGPNQTYPLGFLLSKLPEDEEARARRSQQPPPGDAPGGGSADGFTTASMLMAAIRRGEQWHNSMIRLVAHWIGRGWSNGEILATAEGFTLAGYTVDQTRNEMAKAIEGARKRWGVAEADPVVGDGVPEGMRILSLAELDALPPPEWIIDGLIPEAGFAVPYGPPKSGKTFVMLTAGLHVAAGLPWCGKTVKQGAVVYIAGEGTGGLSLRLKAMREHYGIDVDVPFFVVPRAVNFRDTKAVEALARAIRTAVGNVSVRMIFLDTLARAMPGADENSAQEVGVVIAACDALRDAFNCTVLPIHHSGKDTERGARGTSALRGAWDAAFEVSGHGKTVIFKVVDQKDGESGEVLVFDMVDVQVGLRTTLVPVPRAPSDEADMSPGTSGFPEPTGLTGVAYRALVDILAGPESAILPPLSELPTSETRGTRIEVWRRVFYGLMAARTPEAKKKAFQRSVDALQQMRMVGVKDPWVWPVRQ